MNSGKHCSAATSNAEIVLLTEDDIPGAKLHRPFDSHKIATLRWWLLCQGIKTLASWRKSQVVAQYGIATAGRGIAISCLFLFL